MITYKITLENGESQTTQTGKDLYCSVLDKFNIKYTIEEINRNDIPHSDIRRMESEGVYEEKFQRNSSKSPTYFNEEWNQSNKFDNDDESKYADGVDERPIKKEVEYNDDEFDY